MNDCAYVDEPSERELVGRYAVEVMQSMRPPPDNAREFHNAIEAALLRAGFSVRREAYVGIRESGRSRGAIDLLAQMNGEFVAIELDRRSPRAGSLDKLRAFNAYRIVVLRGAEPWSMERGIDAIISIEVQK